MISIDVSAEFRRKAMLCVLAILGFIALYFVLLASALLTVYATGLLALGIFSLSINLFTLLIGLGLIAMGLLLVVFMLKFLFQRNETQETSDVLITRNQEPQLFALIDEVVSQLDVKPPKKVFLAPDVNASVFYNSSFWSMFFPVRKNLRIGLGLMNALNREELRAVIAHEFGHFSQRSMAVGSYVYTVNQVIFNLVNNDEGFNNLANRIASISAYIYPFVWVAMKVVQGARWLLAQMYKVINLSYLGLSREMEYHADAVAAALGGGHGLASGLRRIDLASNCYQQAVNFAGERLGALERIPNIYSIQTDRLLHAAAKDQLTLRGNLPLVTPNAGGRYLTSKVEIGQQWASHPEVEDRIAHLNLEAEATPVQQTDTAIELLIAPADTQKLFTSNMLLTFHQIKDCRPLSDAEARKLARQQQEEQDLPAFFNGYFDNHNFLPREMSVASDATATPVDQLFAEERVAALDRLLVLRYDVNIFNAIAEKQIEEKTFDYEGKKYHRRAAATLLKKLVPQLELIVEQVAAFDYQIIQSTIIKSRQDGKEEAVKDCFQQFREMDDRYNHISALTESLQAEGEFMQYTMKVEDINKYMLPYQRKVDQLKEALKTLSDTAAFAAVITPTMQEELDAFTEGKAKLFGYGSYNEDAVGKLMTSLQNAGFIINRGYWNAKREMLLMIEDILS